MSALGAPFTEVWPRGGACPHPRSVLREGTLGLCWGLVRSLDGSVLVLRPSDGAALRIRGQVCVNVLSSSVGLSPGVELLADLGRRSLSEEARWFSKDAPFAASPSRAEAPIARTLTSTGLSVRLDCSPSGGCGQEQERVDLLCVSLGPGIAETFSRAVGHVMVDLGERSPACAHFNRGVCLSR